ncbi:ComEC/Rec2 family competence protein, partial [Patescibacteria group bacterium]
FREGLSTSLSAQIGVTPVLFLAFGRYSFISPVVNALVLWTVAPITVIGMIAGIVSIITLQLGKLILLLVYPLTSWFIWIVNLF